jgi:hypothetical protein
MFDVIPNISVFLDNYCHAFGGYHYNNTKELQKNWKKNILYKNTKKLSFFVTCVFTVGVVGDTVGVRFWRQFEIAGS